ncbi:MAG: hypothetical protein AB4426_08695 [Xenococcaceae cyanobacterium]
MNNKLNMVLQQLNRSDLVFLANLNPRQRDSETLLLDFYKKIKSSWSSSALRNFRKETGLKLTNNINRCEFARLAALAELEFIEKSAELNVEKGVVLPETESLQNDTETELPSQIELEGVLSTTQKQLKEASEKVKQLENQLEVKEQELQAKEHKLEKTENFSFLLLTNRLLTPGEPLNGTEESPGMRVLGSPKTLTELEANYRELIKREHPDVSAHSPDLATRRFMYVRSLYRFTRKHWEKLKPTAPISSSELSRRMKASTPYSPESFWV